MLTNRLARGTRVSYLNAAGGTCPRANSDIFRYTIEELCSITTTYTTNSEAAGFHHPPGSKEATLSYGREVASDVASHSAREGTEGNKRRRKQRPQGATTMADYDDSDNGKAGGSGMGHVMTAMHSEKH
jgi:hypothetical protein